MALKPRGLFHPANSYCALMAEHKRKADRDENFQRKIYSCAINKDETAEDKHGNYEEKDTVRVRIWRSLVARNGQELSLQQLGTLAGERNLGDLRSHLSHVERQAKTFGNKSDEWKKRRGLVVKGNDGVTNVIQKVKLRRRKGDRGITLIRLQL
eukprot:CAMPEP_0194215346 /NCGR_PEP_ID=MMETSP0156-20130528/17105_1 /TAXON_ID=33649 /ORGANISM="Thalassionema nitzschioides, Strain L26-B" /LENGTH=153 /DNA_ID=CAMNT_0038943843 /DNA_START=148 /DNA_END=609 /DNA_ORIENTATION=-